jgi:hypothetical protein
MISALLSIACFGELTNAGELLSRYAHHAQITHFASPAQVKECQTYYANLLVRAGCTTADKTGGVFTGADLVC